MLFQKVQGDGKTPSRNKYGIFDNFNVYAKVHQSFIILLALCAGVLATPREAAGQDDFFPSETNLTVHTIPRTIGAGQSIPVQFIAINYENFDWTADNVHLAVVRDSANLLGTDRIDLPPGVTVGFIRQWTFSAMLKAPSTPQTSSSLELQMVKNTGEPLGLPLAVTVDVTDSGLVNASNLSLSTATLYSTTTAQASFTVTNNGTTATTAQVLQLWGSPDQAFWSTRDLKQFGWQLVAGAGSGPPPRAGAAMACDSATGRILLFGGNTGHVVGDTWQYTPPGVSDVPGWKQLDIPGPVPREGHGMVYDSDRGKIILFGGTDHITNKNDTWEFTPESGWVQVAGEGPSPRNHFGMVYDPARKKVLLFGGSETVNPLNDTWEYTPGSGWAQVTTATATAPPPRANFGMAWDSKRGRAILFGGRGYGKLGDMWQYTPDEGWSELPAGSFPAREGQAMFYDPKRDRIVLFGGLDTIDYRGETWEWRDAQGWRRVPTLGPATRANTAGAYDPARGKFTIMGGWDSYYLGDTWELLCGGNDVYLGQVSLDPLAPGESRDLTVTIDPVAAGLPGHVAPGLYWVGLIPDALGATRSESGTADVFLFPQQLAWQSQNPGTGTGTGTSTGGGSGGGPRASVKKWDVFE